MRIKTSENYFHGFCGFTECQRNYCRIHRMLYRDCETAVKTSDGAGATLYELRECPECVAEEQEAKYDRMMNEVKVKTRMTPCCCEECEYWDQEIINA